MPVASAPESAHGLQAEYLSFKTDEHLTDQEFREKVEAYKFEKALDRIQIPKGKEKVEYTVKATDQYPIYTALDQLAQSIPFNSQQERKEFVALLGARISLLGLSTYTAFEGDTFSISGKKNTDKRKLVMTLHPYQGSSETVTISIDLGLPLVEQKISLKQQIQQNARAARSRLNMNALLEQREVSEGTEKDKIPYEVLLAFKRVLDSGSIVRVREALDEETSLEARRDYWNEEVHNYLGEIQFLLTEEKARKVNKLEELKASDGNPQEIRDHQLRIERIDTMLSALDKYDVPQVDPNNPAEIAKAKIPAIPYNGQAELNLVFIEYYRLGQLGGELSGFKGTSVLDAHRKADANEIRPPEEILDDVSTGELREEAAPPKAEKRGWLKRGIKRARAFLEEHALSPEELNNLPPSF